MPSVLTDEYGTGSGVPTYLIRIHHMLPSTAGIAYGAAVSILGTVGGVVGGLLGDRWLAERRSDARILISVIFCIFSIPLVVIPLILLGTLLLPGVRTQYREARGALA